MSFALDLDWCACGKRCSPGALFCSRPCRDGEIHQVRPPAPTSPVLPDSPQSLAESSGARVRLASPHAPRLGHGSPLLLPHPLTTPLSVPLERDRSWALDHAAHARVEAAIGAVDAACHGVRRGARLPPPMVPLGRDSPSPGLWHGVPRAHTARTPAIIPPPSSSVARAAEGPTWPAAAPARRSPGAAAPPPPPPHLASPWPRYAVRGHGWNRVDLDLDHDLGQPSLAHPHHHHQPEGHGYPAYDPSPYCDDPAPLDYDDDAGAALDAAVGIADDEPRWAGYDSHPPRLRTHRFGVRDYGDMPAVRAPSVFDVPLRVAAVAPVAVPFSQARIASPAVGTAKQRCRFPPAASIAATASAAGPVRSTEAPSPPLPSTNPAADAIVAAPVVAAGTGSGKPTPRGATLSAPSIMSWASPSSRPHHHAVAAAKDAPSSMTAVPGAPPPPPLGVVAVTAAAAYLSRRPWAMLV
ncbi:hypothetical protein CXG81DRAFT_21412 [Caulochytrium protostelioides]|uniref:Uncharacterized protein n=1 Tax=Caulochytrium protostelioides TaxID=1555241 RepID=A0A4P9WXY3_9FUNG|nr:hypothetical protein CXG81DRAFT_21412 [Caulochytrium protostelioides]|eukprot:RKO98341.1 hypothetical protein CXG81DRAFT_21412 [Caulochytrium protostelioides]